MFVVESVLKCQKVQTFSVTTYLFNKVAMWLLTEKEEWRNFPSQIPNIQAPVTDKKGNSIFAPTSTAKISINNRGNIHQPFNSITEACYNQVELNPAQQRTKSIRTSTENNSSDSTRVVLGTFIKQRGGVLTGHPVLSKLLSTQWLR